MGKLLCEKNLRDVWCRNESVRAEIGQILHTHTRAAKLVVEISSQTTCHSQVDNDRRMSIIHLEKTSQLAFKTFPVANWYFVTSKLVLEHNTGSVEEMNALACLISVRRRVSSGG